MIFRGFLRTGNVKRVVTPLLYAFLFIVAYTKEYDSNEDQIEKAVGDAAPCHAKRRKLISHSNMKNM